MNSVELKNKLQKSIDFLQSELAQIRTGRANPSLIEDISVNAYESKMLLKELGSITLLDAHTILVSPWDKGLLSSISKAISESEHRLNPLEMGSNLRVPVPLLSEERRKELVKLVSQKTEETKQAIRNIRQDVMKEVDRAFDAKEISEDEKFTEKDDVEETVKKYTKQADEMGETKSSELMTV